MDLSPKAIRFLIDAVQHYEKHFDQRLKEDGLSEDDMADLANDRQYLLALVEELQGLHEIHLKGSLSLQH